MKIVNLFENLKELESMYENLLNEAKIRHTNEFRVLKEEYDLKIDEKSKVLDEFIKKILESLTTELENKTTDYQKNTTELFQKINKNYDLDKEEFIIEIKKILNLPF